MTLETKEAFSNISNVFKIEHTCREHPQRKKACKAEVQYQHSGGAPLILRFFSNPPSHQPKPMPPVGSPPLKNEAPPSEKQTAPIETWNTLQWNDSLEKNTTNLAKILEKYVWRSSFLVNLEACRFIVGNFTIKWTPLQVFFDSILRSPHAS